MRIGVNSGLAVVTQIRGESGPATALGDTVFARTHDSTGTATISAACEMILGLLYEAKKTCTLALQHLTEAKRITSQFGPSLTLTKIDAALAELT